VDGIEALRRSRTGLKIIAVLGDSSLACLESMVDAIVWKPFSVNALATIVSEYIGPAEPILKETAQFTSV
jgi:CheY-like chemotaxis protein